MTPAVAMRAVSRLRMWPISCATTPWSSSRSRSRRSPVVTATAAVSGRRPTANALGEGSSTTKTRGRVPSAAAIVISSTTLKSCGWSCFSISRAPLSESMIRSPLVTDTIQRTAHRASATEPPVSATPRGSTLGSPPARKTAIAAPVATSTTPMTAITAALRRRFERICSHTAAARD
jgi:hypothetical protein